MSILDLEPLARENSPHSLFDPASFASQVHPHRERMLGVARRILGCQDLARDAVQETLILLWKREVAPPDLTNWLVRMTSLRALQIRRSLTRRRLREHDHSHGHDDHEPCNDPAHQLLHEENHREILRAIEDLPESMREVVVLREIEGLDYSQIADVVRVPIGTIRSRLNRARKVLSENVSPMEL